jgi:hypothetical protein
MAPLTDRELSPQVADAATDAHRALREGPRGRTRSPGRWASVLSPSVASSEQSM